MFLKFSQNSQESTCARVSFLIKLLTETEILLKKRLCHRCFPVNFEKFLRIPFSQNTSWGLLLCWTRWNKFLWQESFRLEWKITYLLRKNFYDTKKWAWVIFFNYSSILANLSLNIRCGFRATATSKMERFVIIVNSEYSYKLYSYKKSVS